MENEAKRRRGCNYTPLEKEALLEIVKGHINIIECKATQGLMIKSKQNAWNTIAQEYNAVATTGPRTWPQLRHLYENIKQRAKKNVAKENRLQFYQKEDVLRSVQIKASHDKMQIKQTGGGAYKSVLTDNDCQLLAMIAPQIKPMQNPYDDAAVYFGDVEQLQSVETNINEPSTTITDGIDHDLEVNLANSNTKESYSGPLSPDPRGKKKPFARKIMNNKELSIKEQYFKRKFYNAKLETKFMKEKHNLEITLLTMKINKLK